MFANEFNISAKTHDLKLCRRLAELIGTRAARLSACGIAAICKKNGWQSCHVGADGSVFSKYTYFKSRCATALREILERERGNEPIQVNAAEDGSGVGAALVAALTIKRVESGVHIGVKNIQDILKCTKRKL